jgi:hypothetical protein
MTPTEIYTPFSTIKEELARRQCDDTLRQKIISTWGENLIPFSLDKPLAILSRTVATPNLELRYFIELAKDLNLEPLILEYDGKLVGANMEKYCLCKLLFLDEVNKNNHILEAKKIVDIAKYEGQMFSKVKTLWGESVHDFHHKLLLNEYPNSGEKMFVDITKWFNTARTASDYYYFQYLSLFICNAVLFENFLFDDGSEVSFLKEKIYPSLVEAGRYYGLKPLIFPLVPIGYQKYKHWLAYPAHLKKLIPEN